MLGQFPELALSVYFVMVVLQTDLSTNLADLFNPDFDFGVPSILLTLMTSIYILGKFLWKRRKEEQSRAAVRMNSHQVLDGDLQRNGRNDSFDRFAFLTFKVMGRGEMTQPLIEHCDVIEEEWDQPMEFGRTYTTCQN